MSTEETEGSRGWRWRPKQTRAPRDRLLLYEPGNRGDLLKAAWLLPVAEELRGEAGRSVFDLCAGAPSYPLTAAARSRRGRAPRPLREALIHAGGEDHWPSSGLLLHRRREELGAGGLLRVFDRNRDRLASWRPFSGTEPLVGESGEQILRSIAPLAPALVLIDPYDLFHRWGKWRDGIAAATAGGMVLVYLYNKSPRGEGHRDQYRRLRAALAGVVPAPPLIGRLASDQLAPRALHEVWLLTGSSRRSRLRDALAAATAELVALFPGDAGSANFED